LLDGRKAEQAEITQLLGFGPALFRHAVVFGQESLERFARAEQGAAMRMLDEIQGVSFREALDRAKAWRDEWQRKANALVADATVLTARQAMAARQAGELEAARASFDRDRRAVVEELHRQLGDAEIAVGAAETALAETRRRIQEAKRLKEKLARLDELRAELDSITKEVDRLAFVRDRERDAAKSGAEALSALLGRGKCPTCRQSFEGAGGKAVRQAFRADLEAAQKRVRDAENALVAPQERSRKKAAEIERHLKALGKLTQEQLALAARDADDRLVDWAAEALARARQETARLAEKVVSEQGQTWDGQAALDAAARDRDEAAVALAENAREQTKAAATVRAAEYWVEAFGDRGLRSLLFDSVAGFLNERTAHHLAVLAAGEAAVEMSALKPLKGGTVREGLTTAVRWDWGAGTYAGNSSGQGGRVDLAQFMAIQDLAEQRSARPFPLRVFDEPEAHFDARGKEILAGWIAREARRRGTAFVTTHDADLLGALEPDREWVVVLDRDGARVETS
jgi:DNA repair exonuclease SbcCD ATPase subunit